MPAPKYTIRTLSRQEIDIAVDWAAAEGWNPGLNDADCFYAADPEGFLVGEIDQQPIATISVVKYGQTFGFLGFYIVRPDHRGQGRGLQIWNAGLERLAGRNVGLDGVVAQQDNYKKSGFKLAYRNIRYQGMTGGRLPQPTGLVDLAQVPFDAVEEYDRQLFPDTRRQFLKAWLSQPRHVALGIVQKEKLSAYGVVRPCRSGYKVGPLFADSPDLAGSLFAALKSSVTPGLPIYLDTPEVNPHAVALAERHGMNVVFETARMYTGAFPDLPLNKIFGVTTFELG